LSIKLVLQIIHITHVIHYAKILFAIFLIDFAKIKFINTIESNQIDKII